MFLVSTARLEPGETVLVHGATGVAGQLAIQIAKHLGAGRIVATGRKSDQFLNLPKLGADVVIDLKAQDAELLESYILAAGSTGIDIVLDYLWGAPAEVLLSSLVRKGFPTARTGTRFMQIGESAGPVISLPATTLRGAAITITGSGTMPSREICPKPSSNSWISPRGSSCTSRLRRFRSARFRRPGRGTICMAAGSSWYRSGA